MAACADARHGAPVDACGVTWGGSTGSFGRLSLSYLSERYFTYENDQHVPDQFLADLAVGRRFTRPGWADGLGAQLNVTNLFDAHYISTLGSNDFPIRGDAQTLLAGPPARFSWSCASRPRFFSGHLNRMIRMFS